MTYIAEKNGGTAIYSEDNFFGWGGWNKRVTVTINGVTKVYKVGEQIRIVNGKSIIDSAILRNDFGLSDDESTHLAGDSFSSPEHAAMAFGLTYLAVSKYAHEEYGATIDKKPDGTFTFDNVEWSTKEGNTNDRNSVNVTPNENTVSVIHTHWDPGGSKKFSPGDYQNYARARANGTFNGTYYLVNKDGKIYYMEPEGSSNTDFSNPDKIIDLY